MSLPGAASLAPRWRDAEGFIGAVNPSWPSPAHCWSSWLFDVQEWVRLCPKFSRHIFITDRMRPGGVGPDHEPAAWSMGNSLYQWMKTYYPTFKLEQMRQSQVQMEHYRQRALQQQGQASADPLALLTGAPAPALAPLPPPQPEPAELGQQLHLLQQQQAQMMQQLGQLAAGGLHPAAAPAPLALVKEEPEWPEVSGDDWDLVIDLCSSESGYESAESMDS